MTSSSLGQLSAFSLVVHHRHSCKGVWMRAFHRPSLEVALSPPGMYIRTILCLLLFSSIRGKRNVQPVLYMSLGTISVALT